MGQKLIKLTENDLLKIVKRVISEQSYHTLNATTDLTPIVKSETLQKTGLPCDNTNFKKMWVSAGFVNQLWSTKDLSTLKVSEEVPPTEDYFAVMVFKKVKKSDNSGFMTSPDREQKLFELKKGEGSKTFNTFYTEPNNPNTIWQIGSIKAAGNGLLALARGLKTYTSPDKVPNQITIGFEQSERVSSSLSIDMGKVNDLSTFIHGLAEDFVIAAFMKNGINSKHPRFKKVGTPQDAISKITTDGNRMSYIMDRLFIPQEDIQTVGPKLKSKLDQSKINGLVAAIPVLKSYSVDELKRNQRNNYPIDQIIDKVTTYIGSALNSVIEQYINHHREVYINRFKEYVQLTLPQEQQTPFISAINPTQYYGSLPSQRVQILLDVRVGGPRQQLPDATKETGSGTYQRGASS